ncbi:hypothetical protein [Methylocucumis oryzae]|uniref:Uncharacterized protein n=1 Tax=Methylocucumis oryzae TaxID=1632867 RepID=A0A0F3IR45_9GAMM|nr:hypothetical protein [Methylocucumis oryzae]KJV08054.1 hypothetical protein VZ94_00385 [Methylocucumis oryzae]
MLNDGDANAATRVFDLLLNAMPDGQEAVDADIDSFAWGDNEQEPMMLDSVGGMLKKLGGMFKKGFRDSQRQKKYALISVSAALPG